jgi:hypothetical protein
VQELIEESEIEKWLKEESSEIFEQREGTKNIFKIIF